jgi:hypothetical protein
MRRNYHALGKAIQGSTGSSTIALRKPANAMACITASRTRRTIAGLVTKAGIVALHNPWQRRLADHLV